MSHSSIEVSASTARFFTIITGMPWPEIKEGDLRDIRDAYEQLAKDLPELRDLIATVAARCLREFHGQAAQTFGQRMNSFIGEGEGHGEDYVAGATKSAKELAACAGDVANSVEYTKWMAIAQLVQLMIEIALAIFWSPFSFGASLSGLVLKKLLTKAALKALMLYLLKTILMHTFSGVVGGVILDQILQKIQLDQGNRKTFDKELTRQAALFGLIGGVLGGPLDLLGMGLGKLLGRLLGKSGGRLLADKLSNFLVHGDLEGLKGLLEAAAKGAEKAEAGSLGKMSKAALEKSEQELAKLSFGKKEAKAFSRELGGLMEAASEQLRHGFGKTGKGTLSEIFVKDMERIFGKHLGQSLGSKEIAGKLGREFGEAFAGHWGSNEAARAGVKDALSGVFSKEVGQKLSAREVTMLTEHLPKLAGELTEGNRMFQLGSALGNYIRSGVQNVLTEGFYNLIFDDRHEFSVSAGSFVGGVMTGAMGHLMHLGAHPVMTRYHTWVQEQQSKLVSEGASKYFPLYHPINFAALACLASGKVVPFPVPRIGHPGAFEIAKLHGASLDDIGNAINKFAGVEHESPKADPEVAEAMQKLLDHLELTTGDHGDSDSIGLAGLHFLGENQNTDTHVEPAPPHRKTSSPGEPEPETAGNSNKQTAKSSSSAATPPVRLQSDPDQPTGPKPDASKTEAPKQEAPKNGEPGRPTPRRTQSGDEQAARQPEPRETPEEKTATATASATAARVPTSSDHQPGPNPAPHQPTPHQPTPRPPAREPRTEQQPDPNIASVLLGQEHRQEQTRDRRTGVQEDRDPKLQYLVEDANGELHYLPAERDDDLPMSPPNHDTVLSTPSDDRFPRTLQDGTDGTTGGHTQSNDDTEQQPQPPVQHHLPAADPVNFPGWQYYVDANGAAAAPLRPDRTPGRPGPGPLTDANGVVRDHDGWQLKPGVDPASPIAAFPRAWQRPAGAPERVYYPEGWSADTIARRVVEVVNGNQAHWRPDGLIGVVGRAGDVWIEAVLDPQGRLLYHRPLPDVPVPPAPHEAWNETAVAGRGARTELFGYDKVSLQRVRFDTGQEGFEFTVRVHLEPSAGMTHAEQEAVRQKVRTLATEFTAGQQTGADDGQLLNVRVEFTEAASADAVTVPVTPGMEPTLRDVLPQQFREAAGKHDLDFVMGTQTRKAPRVTEVHVAETGSGGPRSSFTDAAWGNPRRGLPPEWNDAEARIAARHVLRTGTAEVVGEPVADRPAPKVHRGEFAGVRLSVRVEEGVIADVWGEPHQKLRPQTTAPVHEPEVVLVPTKEIRPPQDAFTRATADRRWESFDARRVRLADGDTETVLTVRVHLNLDPALDPADPQTAASLEALRQRGREGVEKVYNLGQRLPSGDLLRVEIEFVADAGTAHHTVAIVEKSARENLGEWGLTTESRVIAHEIGHALGLPDEYREAKSRRRAVHQEPGIMAGRHIDAFGRPWLDMDHSDRGPAQALPHTPPAVRNLRQLGGVVDAAFGRDRGPAPDGDRPARARFREDVLRRALYGGPDGLDGHLVPPLGSERARPQRVPGSEQPNGTFKVVGGPGAAPAMHVGELADHRPRSARTRTVFPEHWTADDASYAAEQAYHHARRTGKVTETGTYAYHWVGEYGGVRIEGEIKAGEFTSFRPSDDQGGLDTPAYVPWRSTGGAFDLRVEDLVRYGDRHTLTGVHHEPTTAAATAHGIKVDDTPLLVNDNGTYRAGIRFLDPAVTVGAPMSEFESRWHRRADWETHTFYPKAWTPHEVLTAVEKAYTARHTSETLESGAVRWVGEADGVRIEGIVRDGRHLTHRPTAEQPLTAWTKAPAGDGTGGPALTGRHVRFADGQLGIEVKVPVHLRLADGASPQDAAAARAAVRKAADEFVRNQRPTWAPCCPTSPAP